MEKVTLSSKELDSLVEYSDSMPEPKTGGRRWKRRDGTKWLVGEYVESGEIDSVQVRWAEVANHSALPDFMAALDGVDEKDVERFAAEWQKGGYVDCDAITDGEPTRSKLEREGWLYESRRVIWTLNQLGMIARD